MTQCDRDESINLFTYGSLMLPTIFQRVAGRCPVALEATLENWERVRVQNESYPAAIPSPGERIRGLLWLSLSSSELLRLDAFEGSDYKREEIQVIDLSGHSHSAQIYGWCQKGKLTNEPWDVHWFETVGVKDFSNKFLL